MTRRPTIIDVARLAGVSKTTVARVVNGEDGLVRAETKQRVMAAVHQLGYERNAVASSLRNDRTFTIALSIPDIMNPFWPEVARGVQDSVETQGYAVVLMNSDWDAQRQHNHLRVVRRNLFDGLIINPAGISDDALSTPGVPVILLDGRDDYPDFDSVGSVSQMAVFIALRHLLELGHTRIGLIAGVPKRPTNQGRYASYVAFHRQNGLPVDDALVAHCDFSQEAGARAMRQLLQLKNPPTAICAGNDILAIGALIAAQEAGLRVPDEMSIIGMDDIYAAATTYPPLTTVAKPKYEIGAAAANLLLQRIEEKGPQQPQHLRLPCHLVARNSTAPPKT